jgi:thiol-disulfide isomerase/thioredoxin
MSEKQKQWLQNGLLVGFLLFLFFTDAGNSVMGGMQQLLLKTGIKDAPTETVSQRSGSYSFTLRTLEGKTIQLSDLKGKVVFFNQWATWCPPCRAEMPAIESLYQSVDKSKVAFVMLSIDKDVQKVPDFVQQKGFTFPVYMPAGPIPAAFAAEVVPTTFILTPDGQIAQRIEGLANYDTDEFRNYLYSLASATRAE